MRTIQREIKRGMVENLTTQLEIKYVYSADVSEKKYKAEFKDKFKTITFDNGGEFMDYKAFRKVI